MLETLPPGTALLKLFKCIYSWTLNVLYRNSIVANNLLLNDIINKVLQFMHF